MAFWGDYHTHTIYSHGTGTVEENVLQAIKLGLKEIGITDHGFKHFTYNVRRMDWPFIVNDVALMKKKYPMINIYLGLETNFNSSDGNIDLLPTDMRYMDIVVCGYHKFVRPNRLADCFRFYMPNFVLDTLGTSTVKTTNRNTDAYIKALEKFDIDIISHMNYGIKVDAVEVAKAAMHYGTYIELNGKRVSMTDEEILKIAELGAEFIVDSDAHSSSRVGEFSVPMKVIERLQIPLSQIANWERLPKLRSRKLKEAFYESKGK